MAVKGMAIAYSATGGLVLLSGIKGSSLSDTAKALLSGNLTLTNTEPITYPAGSTPTGTAATGSAILSDAEKYNGHKYVFGGPSNPTDGWDCSSFVSYVLGHDLGMQLPGNQSWAKATNNGKSHGPTADQFSNCPGFTKTGSDPSQNKAGDLLVWTGHVGFGTGTGRMFSAFDTAQGTLETAASAPYSFVGVYTSTAAAQGNLSNFAAGGSQAVWIADLLAAIGAPNSTANQSSLVNWMAHEEPTADWSHWNNPMNTTQPENGSTSQNGAGVQQYKSLQDGLNATVTTLSNGRYGDILLQLRAGRGLKSGASSGLSTWSGGAYTSV